MEKSRIWPFIRLIRPLMTKLKPPDQVTGQATLIATTITGPATLITTTITDRVTTIIKGPTTML